jgi:ATP-dependent DNA ligase
MGLCLRVPAKTAPNEPNWIYEIKYDGFRILAHRRTASDCRHRRGRSPGASPAMQTNDRLDVHLVAAVGDHECALAAIIA